MVFIAKRISHQGMVFFIRTPAAAYGSPFLFGAERPKVVKGCKMSAPSRRPVSLHENSTGGRLTSLKGGNRGTKPHGQGKSWRYGDLSCYFLVRAGNAAHYRDTHVPCRVGCSQMTPVFLLTVRAKKCISMPSAKRCTYRIRPVIIRSAG